MRLLRRSALRQRRGAQALGLALLARVFACAAQVAPLPPYKQSASNQQNQNLDPLE